jgi:hypothetical protein
VLVDGGVMDNLPVTTMRTVNHGPIIAVDVTRDLAITPQWLKEVRSASLLSRMLSPPIVSILMRAGTVSNEDRARDQLDAAELVISPPLGDIDIRDWRAFDGRSKSATAMRQASWRWRPTACSNLLCRNDPGFGLAPRSSSSARPAAPSRPPCSLASRRDRNVIDLEPADDGSEHGVGGREAAEQERPALATVPSRQLRQISSIRRRRPPVRRQLDAALGPAHVHRAVLRARRWNPACISLATARAMARRAMALGHSRASG